MRWLTITKVTTCILELPVKAVQPHGSGGYIRDENRNLINRYRRRYHGFGEASPWAVFTDTADKLDQPL